MRSVAWAFVVLSALAAAAAQERNYAEHGSCERRFPFAGRGAAWPMHKGPLKLQREFQAGAGSRVTYFEPRYAVLNARFLSFFASAKDAVECKKPTSFARVSDFVGVNVLNTRYLPFEQARTRDAGFCWELVMREAGASYLLCSDNRQEKHEWVDHLRHALRLSEETQMHARDEPALTVASLQLVTDGDALAKLTSLFPMAPRTISLGARRGACLTRGGSGKAALAPAMWASGYPVTAVESQRWSVQQTAQGGVTICVDGAPAPGGVRSQCLTVEEFTEVNATVRDPAREFTDCPGGTLRCFDVPSQTLETRPSPKDADVCERACAKAGDSCQGWTHIRPGVASRMAARCCLKAAAADPARCVSNPCCTSRLYALTHREPRSVRTSELDGGPQSGHVLVAALEGANGSPRTQQWVVTPVSGTRALVQLADGRKCLTSGLRRDVAPSDELPLWLEDCSPGDVDQLFTFSGFDSAAAAAVAASADAELPPAGGTAAASDRVATALENPEGVELGDLKASDLRAMLQAKQQESEAAMPGE